MKMKIPLCIPQIGQEEKAAVNEVLDSGWLAHGSYNKKFEEAFRNIIGASHAITMNSCTSALEVALKVNNVKGEVIVPSFTWVATANAVKNVGAIPIFCDVEFGTRNVTAELIERRVDSKTEAVIVVHYGGQPCRMDEIVELCDQKNLLLIEDSAETLGATWNGQQAGTFGIGCFSFFPTKNITTGEGGMLTCDSKEMADNIRAIIAHGVRSTTYAREKVKKPWLRSASLNGHNFRLSNILAAIGYEQLKKLEFMNAKRVELAQRYNQIIATFNLDIEQPIVAQGATHVYQMYTITVPPSKRDRIVMGLRDEGIGASVHFDPPVHLQHFYYDKSRSQHKHLTQTERVAESIITLPMYPSMTDEDVEYVVRKLKLLFNRK